MDIKRFSSLVVSFTHKNNSDNDNDDDDDDDDDDGGDGDGDGDGDEASQLIHVLILSDQ